LFYFSFKTPLGLKNNKLNLKILFWLLILAKRYY
jgi:hypothetical protein